MTILRGDTVTVTYTAPCPDQCGRDIEWVETHRDAQYGMAHTYDPDVLASAAPTYETPCECNGEAA